MSKILSKRVLRTGLLFCIAIFGGCETPQQTAMLGAALGGVAPYQTDARQAVAAASMSDVASGYANAQVDRNDVVVVNQTSALASSYTKSDGSKSENGYFFICKSWRDDNLDFIPQDHEIVGKGFTFTDHDNILIQAVFLKHTNQQFKIKIIDRSNMKMVFEDSLLISTNASLWGHEFGPGTLKSGEYLIDWFCSGGDRGGQVLRVVEANVSINQEESLHASTQIPKLPSVDSHVGQVVVEGDQTAEVFVDEKFLGNPPAKLKLSVGTHTITVKCAGYKDYTREIQIGEGSELTLRPVLEKEEPSSESE